MTELELILTEAGAALEWPETPDLAAAVTPRLARRAAPAPAFRFRLRRPLAVAIAALLVLAGGAMAVPGIRDPVLDFLGLRSVKIERVPKLPSKPAPVVQTHFGIPTTLAGARKNIDFEPVVPYGLGAPHVYSDDFPPGGRLTLTYRKDKVVLVEFKGRLRRLYLRKFVGPGTDIERVGVNGEPGLWIHGDAHEVVYEDVRGVVGNDRLYLAGNTLLWRRGDLLLRLEGVNKRQGLRIARSVHEAP